MRTLAFAHADLPAGHARRRGRPARPPRRARDADLVFAGFVAIRDPLRDDVKDAVAECRAAGIEVKMITGDNVETARAIARDIGLLDATPIDARSRPDQRRVQRADRRRAEASGCRGCASWPGPGRSTSTAWCKLLQEQGHVVAVTGDGTNDAPSLKKADVGLAMGIAGTEVAKEASKIVLLDDAFATIVKAVHWGRSLYENIQRFIQFQLTINVSALTIAFLGPFFGVQAAVHGAATAVDQRHHGHVRVDRPVLASRRGRA